MEFFQCPCPKKGRVILDGSSQGFNRDNSGNMITKKCNPGLHTIALRCTSKKKCLPEQVQIEIKDTDPISPMEVSFRCV
ncbi:MAG: hypothetical protein ABSE95_18560 [Thermodesulfobacteriota bacterium]|jgi:hypothetical protein